MTVDELFLKFTDGMTQAHLFQRAMRDLAEGELESLDAYYERYKKDPNRSKHREINNMIFYEAETGDIRYFGKVERSIQEQIRSVYLHKNKQYQWLLAEAYELFEDFLEELYAYLGSVDPNSWPMVDFGNLSMSEVVTKNFNWYRQRVREKRNKPDSLLNQFRKTFPEISQIEEDNHFRINLRLSVKAIEMLRHAIVHQSGIVENKVTFVEEVLKKAGLFQNGSPKSEHVGFVNALFSTGQFENHIILLEVPSEKEMPFETYFDKWDTLTGHLVSYADYLAQRVKNHEQHMGI